MYEYWRDLVPRDPKEFQMSTLLTAGPDATSGFAPSATSDSDNEWVKNLGLFTAVLGGINTAVGAYYAAKTAQYQAKSQALDYGFASDMASINAHAAEVDAQSILEAGKSEVARYTTAAGQRKAGAVAGLAARGVQLGQGSARDIEASLDLVKEQDVLTINANAVRAAENERLKRTSYRNQSLLYGVSGANARRTAGSISPFASGMTSLLGSATRIGAQWNQDAMYRQYGGYGR